MANPVVKCAQCGNRWPASGRVGGVIEHKHLTRDERVMQLKKKHRTPKHGWDKVPSPRTGQKKVIGVSIRPRRRAYGPF